MFETGVRVRLIRKLARDGRGATAIEYGLIVALIFIAILGAVHTLATEVIGTWNAVSNKVVNAGTT